MLGQYLHVLPVELQGVALRFFVCKFFFQAVSAQIVGWNPAACEEMLRAFAPGEENHEIDNTVGCGGLVCSGSICGLRFLVDDPRTCHCCGTIYFMSKDACYESRYLRRTGLLKDTQELPNKACLIGHVPYRFVFLQDIAI